MGFFSWNTGDTKESIPNVYQNRKEVKPVYFLQPGGRPPVREVAYGGYGVFGGVDAYAWLARMNMPEKFKSPPLAPGFTQEERDAGIRIETHYLSGGQGVKYPIKLSFDKNARYEDVKPSTRCKFQGYFYKREVEAGYDW